MADFLFGGRGGILRREFTAVPAFAFYGAEKNFQIIIFIGMAARCFSRFFFCRWKDVGGEEKIRQSHTHDPACVFMIGGGEGGGRGK